MILSTISSLILFLQGHKVLGVDYWDVSGAAPDYHLTEANFCSNNLVKWTLLLRQNIWNTSDKTSIFV